jgi:hypothetical protein
MPDSQDGEGAAFGKAVAPQKYRSGQNDECSENMHSTGAVAKWRKFTD